MPLGSEPSTSPPSEPAARCAPAVRRAVLALDRLALSEDAFDDPLVVVALHRRRVNGQVIDVETLLHHFARREPSYGRSNSLRYRWELSWGSAAGSAAYALATDGWPAHWRPAEASLLLARPSAYGRRLMAPIVLAAQFRFWGSLAADPATDPRLARSAAALLAEAVPTAEHDVASWHAALDPWSDTFALWLLAAEPQVMMRLRDLVFGLALRYAAIAQRDGVVRGVAHPFHGRPLASASAHLAASLWRCGIYPSLIPGLVQFVEASLDTTGGWADEGQPPDLLTTLAAADLLLKLDPSFDPGRTADWFLARQEGAGWWRALNPEVPWLTAVVSDWLEAASRPFAARFEWPSSPVWARDRLSGLATLASLEELERAMAALPNLGDQPIQAAFVDLAGFGAWNSTHGQARGDEVIALMGRTLAGLPHVLPVRLGGDEFLVLDKPGAPADRLLRLIEGWMSDWPAQLAARQAHGVAPRVLVGDATAREAGRLRGTLGQAISQLKREAPNPPPTGAVRRHPSPG
jgi:GGDEF domain-containing protein